jgi:hypothetical protein
MKTHLFNPYANDTMIGRPVDVDDQLMVQKSVSQDITLTDSILSIVRQAVPSLTNSAVMGYSIKATVLASIIVPFSVSVIDKLLVRWYSRRGMYKYKISMPSIPQKSNPETFIANTHAYDAIHWYLSSISTNCNFMGTVVSGALSWATRDRHSNCKMSYRVIPDEYSAFKWHDDKQGVTFNMSVKLVGDDTSRNGCLMTLSSDNLQCIENFIDVANIEYKAVHAKKPTHYTYVGVFDPEYRKPGGWIEAEIYVEKQFETLFLTTENKNKLLSHVRSFQTRQQFCEKLKTPYKIGLLLYGSAGSGKSSTSYSISTELQRDIYQITLNSSLSDSALRNAITSIPAGSILLLDDVDAYGIARNREDGYQQESLMYDMSEIADDESPITNIVQDFYGGSNMQNHFPPNMMLGARQLHNPIMNPSQRNTQRPIPTSTANIGTLLGLLDGYTTLRDCIVIMTTNHPDKLDTALVRTGRIDCRIEYGPCVLQQARDICEYVHGKVKTQEILEDIDEDMFSQAKHSVADVMNWVATHGYDTNHLAAEFSKYKRKNSDYQSLQDITDK